MFFTIPFIKSAIPAKIRFADKHPAKRTFQAIRIEVNNELGILEQSICDFVDVLNPGGVLSIITFHSLEDRIVKQAFAKLASGCECPKNFPVCVCGNSPRAKVFKAVSPSAAEVAGNNRSRSARLRTAEKLTD